MTYLRWLAYGALCLLCAGCIGDAHAQSFSQTSVSCALGASPVKGANQCKQQQTYGLILGNTSVEFLGQDPTRNSLIVQNTGSNTACIKFEMDGSDAHTSPVQDCFNVPTGQPLYFSNFPTTTSQTRGIISGVTGISPGGTSITFMFMEQ